MAFDKKYNPCEKQRINLSAQATNVTASDMIAFGNSKPNNFLNRVIKNFKDDADASISIALDREKERLSKVLHSTEAEAIQLLLAEKEKELIFKSSDYEKHNSILITLSKEIRTFLSNKDCEEDKYYNNNIGRYIKAIIEEYASKTFAERELIYFADRVTMIRNSIENRSKLTVIYSDEKHYTIQPYRIVRDSMNMYNYIIGFSAEASGKEKKPVSVRISGNFELRQKKNANSAISDADKRILDDCIKNRGVQFLLGEETEIVVSLTEEGRRRFTSNLYLRPDCVDIRNNKDYVFM